MLRRRHDELTEQGSEEMQDWHLVHDVDKEIAISRCIFDHERRRPERLGLRDQHQAEDVMGLGDCQRAPENNRGVNSRRVIHD